MRDGPGEEEVERRAAALARDVLDDAAEAVAADEERERLVLVRRPGHQLVERGTPLAAAAIAPTPSESAWRRANARAEAGPRTRERRVASARLSHAGFVPHLRW